MPSQTIFLSGVAGFIGSNTAEVLLKQGNRVVGFDNLAKVYSVEKKRHNLKQVAAAAPEKDAFHFIEGDLREAKQVEQALASQKIDAIIHLAALAGVQPSIADPVAYADVNIHGTLNIFEAAKKSNIQSIVSASSSSVYGANKKLPFSETDPVDHPISPYAATKRAGELLAHTYSHLHGLSIACMRFFTVYGPRQRPDLAIYKFTRAMLKGDEITLYGDGSSRRDYTYIEDCVDGILRALDWACQGQGRSDIFNLGEAQTVSLLDLVAHLENILKVKAKRRFADYLPGDVFATFADLSQSEMILGYRPRIKIEEGLKKFCEWYLKEEKDQPWAK